MDLWTSDNGGHIVDTLGAGVLSTSTVREVVPYRDAGSGGGLSPLSVLAK